MWFLKCANVCDCFHPCLKKCLQWQQNYARWFHSHQTRQYAIFQLTTKKPSIDHSDLRYLMQRSLRKLKLEIVLASIRPEPKRCRNDVENSWPITSFIDMIQATTHSWFAGLQPSIYAFVRKKQQGSHWMTR